MRRKVRKRYTKPVLLCVLTPSLTSLPSKYKISTKFCLFTSHDIYTRFSVTRPQVGPFNGFSRVMAQTMRNLPGTQKANSQCTEYATHQTHLHFILYLACVQRV